MTATKDDGTKEAAPVRRRVDVLYRSAVRHILLEVVDDQGHELDEPCAWQWRRMRFSARVAGVDLRINTAFRSREYQQQLYDRWLAYKTYLADSVKWAKSNRPGPEPERVPWAPLAAAPGTSLHEIGHAVDVDRDDGDDPKTARADSPVDLWLEANAGAFGFRRDVPGELWHLSWYA